MMGHHEKMVSGDEVDAFTRWRKYLHSRPGKWKRIKRKFNRRVRQEVRRTLPNEANTWLSVR